MHPALFITIWIFCTIDNSSYYREIYIKFKFHLSCKVYFLHSQNLIHLNLATTDMTIRISIFLERQNLMRNVFTIVKNSRELSDLFYRNLTSNSGHLFNCQKPIIKNTQNIIFYDKNSFFKHFLRLMTVDWYFCNIFGKPLQGMNISN